MAKSRICLLAVILAVLSAISVNAQEITVTDFYLDEHDLTANRYPVEDQNGEKCALIRVQTTQKGFVFDVGSAGITKVEDDKPGEIWLWVPFGIKNISIRHEKLGSLPKYSFPIAIKKARVYIMKITHEKVFTTNYDDSKKQKLSIKITPSTANLSINGMSVPINKNGEAIMDMAYGEFAYKVEAARFYPEEGLVTVDDTHKTLVVNNLKPIMGKLSVTTYPLNAKVALADGRSIERSSIEPVALQIGEYEVTVSANGYKPETKTITITENQTTEAKINLSQTADYRFTSTPNSATIYVNNNEIGETPITKTFTTGTYTIKATKPGYKDFEQQMHLSSSEPEVFVLLKKIYNYRDELYIEANLRAGAMTGMGLTFGGYKNDINVEIAYYHGFGKSEDIYWCDDVTWPRKCTYSPKSNLSLKGGYGIPLATRYRITPQTGIFYTRLANDVDKSFKPSSSISSTYFNKGSKFASGASSTSLIIAARLSAAFNEQFAVSFTPEYLIGIKKSDGFEKLADVSSKIKKWSTGLNVKLGLVVFF